MTIDTDDIRKAAEAASAAVAFITAVAGSVAGSAWVQRYKSRRRRATRISKRIANVTEIYEALVAVGVNFGCARVVMLVAENGSNLFPSYGTVVYEVILSQELRPRKHQWQRTVLDRGYKHKIGAAVNTDRDFEVVRTKLLPKGILKDVYTADGIGSSVIVPLLRSHCDDWAVYLSINLFTDNGLTSAQQLATRTGAARLRTKLRRHIPE